jgi:hypothetical protein
MPDHPQIVPFGKYKGQPVEVLQQDTAYCEWLGQQDWFRARYTAIHTLIINHFAADAETPDHNALQALFTDDAWVRRFLDGRIQAMSAPLLQRAVERAREWHHELTAKQRGESEHLAEARQALAAATTDPGGFKQGHVRRLEESLAEAAAVLARYEKMIAWFPTTAPQARWHITFEEQGVDVTLNYTVFAPMPPNMFIEGSAEYVPRHFELTIECKPSLGDDYPAVLRQMRASKSNLLLIGHAGYQGVGASFDQVVHIFQSAAIEIVRLADVPA